MTKIGVFTITIINLFWHVFQSSVSSVFMCTPYPTIIILGFALTTQEQDNIPEDIYNIFSQAKSFMLGKRYKLLIDFINSMPSFCH